MRGFSVGEEMHRKKPSNGIALFARRKFLIRKRPTLKQSRPLSVFLIRRFSAFRDIHIAFSSVRSFSRFLG